MHIYIYTFICILYIIHEKNAMLLKQTMKNKGYLKQVANL